VKKIGLAYILFGILLPTVLLCGAGFFVFAVIKDIDVLKIAWTPMFFGLTLPRPVELIAAAILFVLSVIIYAVALNKARYVRRLRRSGGCPKAYKGGGAYAFASYAPRDNKTVSQTICQLQAAGINVWFDEEKAGDDRMDRLAHKIDGCTVFIMFQSRSFMRSADCLGEISRAVKGNKSIIRIILHDCELPAGLRVYLDAIQAIDYRFGMQNKLQKLITLLCPGCRDRG